jgi:hypothetical protein
MHGYISVVTDSHVFVYALRSTIYMADAVWLLQTTSTPPRLIRYISMLGVAGFAAAVDYFYFIVDGFTSCADNFVSVVVGFAAMAEYIVFVGYSFESVVNNTAIRHISIHARRRWLRRRRRLSITKAGLASCV